MRLLFSKSASPHHGFAAYYTYLEKIFKADAVLHFGTHGSLEFMPGKQVSFVCCHGASYGCSVAANSSRVLFFIRQPASFEMTNVISVGGGGRYPSSSPFVDRSS